MSNDQNIQDILETVVFLKDNMASKADLVDFATKDDLKNFATKIDLKEELENFATKDDFQEFRSEIISHVDRFMKLHETMDQELVAVRHRCDRLEDYIQQIASHLNFRLRSD